MGRREGRWTSRLASNAKVLGDSYLFLLKGCLALSYTRLNLFMVLKAPAGLKIRAKPGKAGDEGISKPFLLDGSS